MKIRSNSLCAVSAAFALCFTLACASTVELPRLLETGAPQPSQLALSPSPEATSPVLATPTDCPNGDCAKACLARLSSIPQSSGTSEDRPQVSGHGTTKAPADVLVTYSVKGDKLGAPRYSDQVPASLSQLQHDHAAQQKIWEYFTAIIPLDQRPHLVYYIVSTDGKGGMLASVEQFSGSSGLWALVVDPADAAKPRDLSFTLLHEFGHLLTLNSSQVTPDQAVLEHPDDLQVYEREAASCKQFFASGGCSTPDSYINQFFERYWTKVYGEWTTVNAARKESNYISLLSRFYRNHPTQFITPYAATGPEEDIAESWSYFVLNARPADDSVAHRKVLFFYDFPELVDLRNQIIANMCAYTAAGQ